MKVKELAENLKTTTVELINKLSNVIFTEKITEEYEVSKDLEKKLAKMYRVSYPFKSNKPKSLNRPAVRIGSNKQEDELKSKSFSNQKPSKSSIPNNSKPVSNSLKSSEKRENQKKSLAISIIWSLPAKKQKKNGMSRWNSWRITLRKTGNLGDIAPTMLELLEIEKPIQMTGKSMILKK